MDGHRGELPCNGHDDTVIPCVLGFLVVIRFSFFNVFYFSHSACLFRPLSLTPPTPPPSPNPPSPLRPPLLSTQYYSNPFARPTLPISVSLTLSHRLYFSLSFLSTFLTRSPRLPPPDTRSTVLIFHRHRRGNRWSDEKNEPFYDVSFFYINYTYLPSNRFRLKIIIFVFLVYNISNNNVYSVFYITYL